ncbi:hypothetical protein CYMTET_46861 [Cymbomonas tetramitiformis]|uniref:Uncharacterized protein n=1 Tax=Cymbomonas tetramitiformis TaxID=36881 RepID=A0AAE0EX57_9CHLO|nr:hypothetical protein CYMTET_46861 [Cymbomonas tetramitiformis]
MSSSITLPTLDGAANNKKAFKVMKKRFKVEANVAKGKEFPLQHRCLRPAAWRKNNELESAMTTAYDVSQALQGHEGVGLDKEYILASALHNDLTSTVLPVVSGVGEIETWDEVHFENLSSDV